MRAFGRPRSRRFSVSRAATSRQPASSRLRIRTPAGTDYTFPPGASLDPASFVVLAKNPALFAQKYPGVAVLGAYGPSSSLDNSGETVTLSDVAGGAIFSVTYDDKAPWPVGADGG